jgi:hypothetical protein
VPSSIFKNKLTKSQEKKKIPTQNKGEKAKFYPIEIA